ncbi:MAG: response regulator [Chitinispirillia bacterium]|nr:response regulator [Chitinispirillia bacterium]MCL2241388.1 response regulator [Chitinispirillia bacterium]
MLQTNTEKDKTQIRVLVIEDEDYSRDCISDFLELVGFSAIRAANGREGIELFGRHEPDIILTDIRMPEMDGFAILKFLQTYSSATPVIVISGTDSLDDVAQCLKLGAWDYIVKPVYDYGVVEMAIMRALEKKHLIEENRRYREYLEEEVIKRSDELLNNTVRMEQEREEMRTQVMAAQKMEIVGLLTGGIAHDFNNVLTALTGYVSLLQTSIGETSGPTSEYLTKIADIAGRGQKLTGRLMSFIRKKRDELTAVDIHKALRDAETLLRPNCKQIHVKLDLGAQDVLVLGDEAQIQSAFLNLGLNARDAMPGGGDLTFKTSNVERDLGEGYGPGKFIRIDVVDTGIGIDESIVKKIFEPLFTTKAPGVGTGLGLSGVLYCVKRFHGHIDLESTIGKGTTFKIFLPLYNPNATQEEAVPPVSDEECVTFGDSPDRFLESLVTYMGERRPEAQ